MSINDDINNFVPSILNPRSIRKAHDITLTQRSILSRTSLSLRRPEGSPVTELDKAKSNKENIQHPVTQKHQNLPLVKKSLLDVENISPQKLFSSHISLTKDLRDIPNTAEEKNADEDSISFTFLLDRPRNQDKDLEINLNQKSIESWFIDFDTPQEDLFVEKADSINVYRADVDTISIKSLISISSATELNDDKSESTLTYNYMDDANKQVTKPTIQVAFGVKDSEVVNVNTKNLSITKFTVSHKNKDTDIACEVKENSQISTETEVIDENMNITSSPVKRPAVEVNLEIKKQKLTHNDSLTKDSKVLILKTDVIEKISNIIVQPPNNKFVKRYLGHKSDNKKAKLTKQNGISKIDKLKQSAIESFFRIGSKVKPGGDVNNVSKEMSKNLGVIESAKCDRVKRATPRKEDLNKLLRRELTESPKSVKLPSKKDIVTRRQDVKSSNSDAPSPRIRNESLSAHTPRKNVESIHFNLPVKSKSNRTTLSPRNIPHHKIVAGTHFAVDAFSYGDIPNVKHYFLTHFHSDHYSGLKKTFNKTLFCSKITADLCISRLGVNPKHIRVINVDDVVRVEGVEVVAVDANHCPGALMLIFTLPTGKTLLHTGDFRACPAMESYPVFWNKDIHTVYLDTTYCNPRYDFPTQDQSLEMALYILRQKKLALENAGKKFSSVLIVCGTYTIGKEKFFLGMSRRVGCGVWACPEKERVLQIVGGSAGTDPPHSCQLHVVPMRDLTHEKLRSYLDSLAGAFSEVVAFKPSGWENGKNSSVEKDLVTIHGIPYSEHSSFSELIRFIKFLKPKQVIPTVDISGGVKSVQKYFPCPLVYKDEQQCQAKLTDYFSIHRNHVPAVT